MVAEVRQRSQILKKVEKCHFGNHKESVKHPRKSSIEEGRTFWMEGGGQLRLGTNVDQNI